MRLFASLGSRLASIALVAVAGVTIALASQGAAQDQPPPPPASAPIPVQAAQILRRLPHDDKAYTEGLFIDRGELFESTGEVGRSSIRRVDLATGRVLSRTTIPAPLFGEGIVPWRDEILSLTWQHGIGFRWSRKGFKKRDQFSYLGEGWSLTSTGPGAGTQLIMSDGTATLRFIDPATFRTLRYLPVTANGQPLPMLNELEYVDGEVLANIWMTDLIARIDPATGQVIGYIDVAALHREAGRTGQDQVPNGIAWDAQHRRLYVTGKEWPLLFEIAPPKGR